MTDNVEELQKRLQEAESIVAALKGDEVDAVVTKKHVALLRLRQAEEKLRKSEKHLRMALQIGKIGTRYLDLQSKKLDMSKRARQIYGLPLEGEVTVAQILKMVHPDDRPEIKKMFSRAKKAAAKFENEHRVVHPDGSEHWVSSRSESFLDAQGKMGFNIGMVMDITEKKMYEKQLEDLVEERTAELENTNTALTILLNKREKDQENIEGKILANHQSLIEPLLNRLKKSIANKNQHNLLEILESNLASMLSPFSQKLTDPMIQLTPKELQIASFIKQDYSNKEIAETFNCSVRTIDTHRNNIRKKLGIKNKKLNLKTYLMTLQ
jgi:PAS domain S-box-containing protein